MKQTTNLTLLVATFHANMRLCFPVSGEDVMEIGAGSTNSCSMSPIGFEMGVLGPLDVEKGRLG